MQITGPGVVDMDEAAVFAWARALHIAFMVCWFSGIFYLPRLFVNHAMSTEASTRAQFCVMEQKLYRFMTPFAWLTLLLGAYMLATRWQVYLQQNWMIAKIVLVTALVVYHLVCGHFVRSFALQRNSRSHVFYRWFNEFPVLILFGVIFLVALKPF